MKSLAVRLFVTSLAALVAGAISAQTPPEDSDASELLTLTKKIDEQNMKIDLLSQQLLKLEQQIATIRPGVMIGEPTPSPVPVTASSPSPGTGNAHVVAKGETLTSIAKTYKVGVAELQKFNHIENDRALQIGQTIMIPTAGGASPSPSPTAAR